MKLNNVELENNDVYFMETVEDLLVVNDNYHGILIFDSGLRQVAQIELMKDLSIYTSFKKNRELLLFCPDNDCLIYVDLDSKQKKIIALAGFDNWIFSPLYDWNQERLILSDYQGHFVKVDLNTGCLIKSGLHDIECRAMRKDYATLSKLQILKAFIFEKKVIIENPDSKISIIDYNHGLNILKEISKEQYHDFELTNGYIAKIGENKVENSFKNKIEICYPSERYIFLRGKFMSDGFEVYLFLLSSDKSEPNHIKIEKYKL